MKTNELTGPALDYAVARIEHPNVKAYLSARHPDECWINVWPGGHDVYSPSSDWSQGGPIIEREQIDLMHIRRFKTWTARASQRGREASPVTARGETALIAAMRCFVASKLGDEVEIPPELNK